MTPRFSRAVSVATFRATLPVGTADGAQSPRNSVCDWGRIVNLAKVPISVIVLPQIVFLLHSELQTSASQHA